MHLAIRPDVARHGQHNQVGVIVRMMGKHCTGGVQVQAKHVGLRIIRVTSPLLPRCRPHDQEAPFKA